MGWNPARAWTSQDPVGGYRHFQLVLQAAVAINVGSSWQPCWSRAIASECAGVI